ncbi:MAG: hypothetical protein R3F61_37565 [Myxococcota bacterium]
MTDGGPLQRGFLPTWIGAAGILAIQMVVTGLLREVPDAREVAWSQDASLLVAVLVFTVAGAWAFPHVRAMVWLIGSLCAALLGMQHAIAPGPAAPNEEVFAFYSVGAVLLAIGAWERARSSAG